MATAGIYNGNPLKSVFDYRNDIARGDLMQSQSQSNALAMEQERSKMAGERSAQAEQQQLVNALSSLGPNSTPQSRVQAARSLGTRTAYGWADAHEKEASVQASAASQNAKRGAEMTGEHYKLLKQMSGIVTQDPRPETAAKLLDDWERLTGMPAGAVRDAFVNAGDNPEQIKRIGFAIGVEADKLLPTTRQVDSGASNDLITTDFVGKPIGATSIPKSVSPSVQLQSDTQVQIAGMPGRGSAPERQLPIKDGDIIDPNDKTQIIKVDMNRWNPATREGFIGVTGKVPAAAAAADKKEVKNQGKLDAVGIIDELRSAYKELDTARAIPSTERNIASNVMSAIGASSIGQATGKAIGTKEQVQRDVIGSSKLRLLNAIKQSTGMSAQQLNSNMELKLWLDAVTDPGQSFQSVNKILDNIESFITSNRKGGGESAPDGIDPEDWKHMTPEERSLWPK